MALPLGRLGQLYAKLESAYGTMPSLAVSNAVRHQSFTLTFNNKNKRTIMEKQQSPWTLVPNRTDGRVSGEFKYDGVIRPSAVLNTVPELDPILEAAFGTKTNVTLSTTFSGSPTVSSGTIASAAGLAVGDFVLITCPDGKKRLRRVTTASTSLTWTPNLPSGQAPASGAACKGVLTYKMTAALAVSLSFAYYRKTAAAAAALKQAAEGSMVDSLSLVFDANDDPKISASGPCQAVVDPPSQPGGFTMVGSTPPSGITGEMFIGNNPMPFLKCNFSLKNGLWLRNDEYGVTSASEGLRKDRAELTVGINCRAEDETILYDLTEAGTNAGVFVQTGYVEGNCMAMYCPVVEFPPPGVDDPDDLVNFDFASGMALASADSVLDFGFFALG